MSAVVFEEEIRISVYPRHRRLGRVFIGTISKSSVTGLWEFWGGHNLSGEESQEIALKLHRLNHPGSQVELKIEPIERRPSLLQRMFGTQQDKP